MAVPFFVLCEVKVRYAVQGLLYGKVYCTNGKNSSREHLAPTSQTLQIVDFAQDVCGFST